MQKKGHQESNFLLLLILGIFNGFFSSKSSGRRRYQTEKEMQKTFRVAELFLAFFNKYFLIQKYFQSVGAESDKGYSCPGICRLSQA